MRPVTTRIYTWGIPGRCWGVDGLLSGWIFWPCVLPVSVLCHYVSDFTCVLLLRHVIRERSTAKSSLPAALFLRSLRVALRCLMVAFRLLFPLLSCARPDTALHSTRFGNSAARLHAMFVVFESAAQVGELP